jgi:leucyl aminopeptidase (aminopeptidase T)
MELIIEESLLIVLVAIHLGILGLYGWYLLKINSKQRVIEEALTELNPDTEDEAYQKWLGALIEDRAEIGCLIAINTYNELLESGKTVENTVKERKAAQERKVKPTYEEIRKQHNNKPKIVIPRGKQ